MRSEKLYTAYVIVSHRVQKIGQKPNLILKFYEILLRRRYNFDLKIMNRIFFLIFMYWRAFNSFLSKKIDCFSWEHKDLYLSFNNLKIMYFQIILLVSISVYFIFSKTIICRYVFQNSPYSENQICRNFKTPPTASIGFHIVFFPLEIIGNVRVIHYFMSNVKLQKLEKKRSKANHLSLK